MFSERYCKNNEKKSVDTNTILQKQRKAVIKAKKKKNQFCPLGRVFVE